MNLKPDINTEKGYFFIATGKRCQNEIRVTVPQIKKFTSLPVCIASDLKPEVDFDVFIPIKSPHYSYFDKVKAIMLSPFSKTIFLDSDLTFFRSPDEIFDGLEGVDFMASFEVGMGFNEHSQKAMIPNSFPELSSGMLAFNNNAKVQDLFHHWEREYLFLFEKFGIKADQPSLRRALFKSKVKFCVLPPELHCIPAIFTRVVGKSVICVHNHNFERARQIGTLINDRKYAECCGYVDGFGVMRNPYSMDFLECVQFFFKIIRLFMFLIPRALYISFKSQMRNKPSGTK